MEASMRLNWHCMIHRVRRLNQQNKKTIKMLCLVKAILDANIYICRNSHSVTKISDLL